MDSLLINLGSGAIGALLGAFAAYRLQIRESRKLAKGAARVVYLELTGNLTTLQGARPGVALIGAFSRDAWQAEQARLASYVTPEQLMMVAYAYSLFPNGQAALDELRRSGPIMDVSDEVSMVGHVAAAMGDAAESLNRNQTVWSAAEHERLEKLASDVRDAATK